MSVTSKLDHRLVMDAAQALKHKVTRTPVIESSYFNKASGCNVYFKCENFQKTGAFKFRGASNAVRLLDPSISSVITHSSGNHAAALTKAAVLSGRDAHIIMPNNAPIIKQNMVREYGGKITFCEPTLQSREDTANHVQKQTNAALIHAYNNEHVIYGQGTQGVELMEDCPDLDCILVPVGGGGMISGITLATMNFNRNIAVIGCEPLGADDAYQSKLKGQIVPQLAPDTIADGLRTSLGSNTFPIIYNFVNQIIRVSDDEIVNGMRDVYERMKLVIEPSAGVGPAVLLKKEFKEFVENNNIKNVGVILCGGNVDLNVLKTIILKMSGLYCVEEMLI
eukprot:1041612_1